MDLLKGKQKSKTTEDSEQKTNTGISLMKHNRLRVLSESSSNKIISSKNDLVINTNENFIYKKNITIPEKINQLKRKKYYLRKNSNKFSSNTSVNEGNSNSSSNNDISNSEISESSLSHAPLIPAKSYTAETKHSKSKYSKDIKESTSTQSLNLFDYNTTDPSTLAQPIRQELQVKAKESISDIILACRSLLQTSNVSNDLTKAAYNFSLLDSVFSDIDNSITKINQNLDICKQKNNEILKSLNELGKTQEDSRRIKDLIVAYVTE